MRSGVINGGMEIYLGHPCGVEMLEILLTPLWGLRCWRSSCLARRMWQVSSLHWQETIVMKMEARVLN